MKIYLNNYYVLNGFIYQGIPKNVSFIEILLYNEVS